MSAGPLSLPERDHTALRVPDEASLAQRVLAYHFQVAPGVRVRPRAIPKSQIRFSKDARRIDRFEAPPDRSSGAAKFTGTVLGAALGDGADDFFTPSEEQGWGWVTGAIVVGGHTVPVSGPLLTRPVSVGETEGRVSSRGAWSVATWLWSEPMARLNLSGPVSPDDCNVDEIRALIRRIDTGTEPPLVFDPIYGIFEPRYDNNWSGVPLSDGLREHAVPVPTQAAMAVWGEDESSAPTGESASSLLSPVLLNQSQHRAVQLAKTEPLTVVSGPPGTGKTHLLAAMALEQLAAGKNALLVCDSLTAVDAVASMLRRFPMVTAIRFGSSTDPVVLGNRLADGTDDGDPRFNQDLARRELKEVDAKLDELIARISARLRSLGSTQSVAPDDAAHHERGVDGVDGLADRFDEIRGLLAKAQQRGLRALIRRRRALRALRSTLGVGSAAKVEQLQRMVDQIGAASAGTETEQISGLWSRLDELEQQRVRAAATLLEAQRRASAPPNAQRSLGNLAGALRQRPAERRSILRSADQKFLAAAPLWFGTLDSVHFTLPHEREAFDLVIFDEASQVSQVEAWPALERAKRVVVIGDPRQLRHEPLTSGQDHRTAAALAGLSDDERDAHHEATMSLYDVAAQRAQVIRLDEHFRCSPHIIGFSSERFYEDRLQLMTNHPSREARDAIHIDQVPARDMADDAGAHSFSHEVDAASRRLKQLVDFGFKSVAVIAATADLAPALAAAATRVAPRPERSGLDIRVGAVSDFQGLEFDAAIVVIGVADGQWERLAEVESPAAFNVMSTRARRDIYVVTSLEQDRLPHGLLRDYLEWSEYPLDPLQGAVDGTGWTGELARDLDDTPDMRVVVNYPVGAHTVDIVVGMGTDAFGIETSLHPDGPAAHIDRHLALRRAGWTLVDALEADWEGRRGECAPWLVAQWKRRAGIS